MKMVLVILTALLFYPHQSQAKNKIDLDDVSIKGELRNDDRLVIIAREKNELKNHVKFRTNYRKEIIEELPLPAPSVQLDGNSN